jgi:hypothetical protein
MRSSNEGPEPRDLAEAVALLDGAVDRLSADLIALDGAVSRLAALADRWDRVAEQLALKSPALADQARTLANTIRDGSAHSSDWSKTSAQLAGLGGNLADQLRS